MVGKPIRWSLAIVALVAGLTVVAAPVHAQTMTGQVKGKVVDAQN